MSRVMKKKILTQQVVMLIKFQFFNLFLVIYNSYRMLAYHFTNIFRRFSTTSKSLVHMNQSEKELFLKRLEQAAFVDYKVYPALPHQDPKSPQYIASELDEYHDSTEVKEYNKVIDQFKHDLKLQREIWDSLSKIDRPYKRGIRGIDTNLNDQVYEHKFPETGAPRVNPTKQFDFFFNNEDRFAAQAIWHRKHDLKHVLEWEKQRLNRPVTRDYHQAKGYKYDVPIKPEEKYQYLADRLGHPEFFGAPWERLLKLQKDIYHPVYIDQPFVKLPSQGPHESLNFEQGEVIYENSRVMEWIRAIQLGTVGLIGYFGVFIPLNMGYKTHLVTEKADEMVLLQQHLFSPYNIDILRLFTPISAMAIYYVIYWAMRSVHDVATQYAFKVSYSKDRELLFVKRINNLGMIEEDVYETAHLEILPPNQRAGVQDLSSQDEDGIWRITCLNTNNTILLYNNPEHWNLKLKDQFLQNMLNLWDKSYYGYNRPENTELDRKWKEEAYASIHQQALPK